MEQSNEDKKIAQLKKQIHELELEVENLKRFIGGVK